MTTEKEFQAQVVELATVCGWTYNHTRPTSNGKKGWTTPTTLKGMPDLTFMKPGVGVFFAELKTEIGPIRPEQRQIVDLINACPGTAAYLWRPSDWTDIVAVLNRRPQQPLPNESETP